MADEVQRLAVAMDLAFLEADRLLSEDDADAAAATLERQRFELADADGRLRAAVSAAMVERAAEDVVAHAARRLDGQQPTVGQASDDPNGVLGHRLLGRVPAVVAAAVALVLGLLTLYTGPDDLPVDPAATEGPLADATVPNLAAPGLNPTGEAAPTASSPGSSSERLTGPTIGDSALASNVSPRILDLVERVLAAATSDDFDQIAQSPLLDEVEGEELEAALALIEEMLDQAADPAVVTDPSTQDEPADIAPTELPADPTSDPTAGTDILGGEQP